jgi:stage IV sporulation protein B
MLCLVFTAALPAFFIPDEIVLPEGQKGAYTLQNPFYITASADRNSVISLDGVMIDANEAGSAELNLSFLGLIPYKTAKVNVLANRTLVACGDTVGVRLFVDGIIVAGVSEIITNSNARVSPGKAAGLKPGDIIVSVDGEDEVDVEMLADRIEMACDAGLTLQVLRDGKVFDTVITPVIAADGLMPKLGLWVRDNTAGIGTLTFYDQQSRRFGALGHGITDIDTGVLIPLKSGSITPSDIVGIKKGKTGAPGELRGTFEENSIVIGEVEKNTAHGLYGSIKPDMLINAGVLCQAGARSQIETGAAKILSNINGEDSRQYDIEIIKVSRQNMNGSKSMVLKIVDEELLNSTGGIVQGMSGSPIIQNGLLIGAVTHVFVNDPTRGYGIFIDVMLRE